METPLQQAEPDSAVWCDDDEDAVEQLEAPVLGRIAAADWLERIGRRREARRMRRTGSVSRRRRTLRTPARLRYRASRRSESRPRELGRGRSHARRGPPASDDPDPEPSQTDVDVVFLDALARFETRREFDELAVRCLRKASFLIAIGWPR
jgi:hypothetical protein